MVALERVGKLYPKVAACFDAQRLEGDARERAVAQREQRERVRHVRTGFGVVGRERGEVLIPVERRDGRRRVAVRHKRVLKVIGHEREFKKMNVCDRASINTQS